MSHSAWRLTGCTLALALAVALSARSQPPAATPSGTPTFPEPTKFDSHPASIGDNAAEVLAIAYAPDRETLATGGADKVVRLWEVASGRIIGAFEGHTDAIAGLTFSPDGKRLASASYDRSIRIWELANWKAGGPTPPAK